MSFKKCIEDGVKEGLIKQDQADEVFELFDDLETQYNTQMGGAAANAKASIDAIGAMKKLKADKKRQALLQAQSQINILNDFKNYKNGNDINGAAKALFDRDEFTIKGFNSAHDLERAQLNRATRKLDEFLGTFRRNIVGETRKKALLKQVGRELFGDNTNNVNAKEIAQAVRFVQNDQRMQFNAAGGSIGYIENYGMPTNYNAVKVRQAGYKNFSKIMNDNLDFETMIDHTTNLKFSREKFELVLRESFKNISTDGYNKLTPTGVMGGKSLANKRQDHRFFHYKNFDAWMNVQEAFGNKNPFDTIMANISAMARDIALMERLGPNPNATVNFVKQTVEKENALKGNFEKTNKTKKSIDNLYKIITGRNNAPIDAKFASTMAGTRQILQSAQLGSAAVSAITDVNFQRIARGMNGLPQVNILNGYIKNLAKSKDSAQLAIRLGLIADEWTTMAAAQARYVGDMSGPEITRRIADFTMKASLLSPWTNAGRHVFGMEFLSFLAAESNKSFKQLNPTLQKALERYNLSGSRWDLIRKTPLYEDRGVKFLRAEDIEYNANINPEIAKELATNLMVMIERETNFAVPSTTIRGQEFLGLAEEPGALPGEFLRSFAMYKNFGVTLHLTHITRAMSQKTHMGKASMMANLVISSTIMGALALQLKEISGKGREPKPMLTGDIKKDSAFWGAAILQGGGFGIFGDFLFNDVNRYGGGVVQTIAGPVAGLGEDILKLTVGNALQVASGKPTNFNSELIGFTARNLPGSRIWYLRLAFERLIVDQLKLFADNDASSKFRRTVSKYEKQGQDYWWSPGETSPERGPDLSKMLSN